MNLIEQIKVNDTSIDGYQGTYYTESPEYVQVTTDSEGKVLEGIKIDGSKHIAGDLTVDGSIYNEAFDLKVDSAIEEIEEIIGSAGDALTYFESIDNPEWLQVTTDSSGRILGCRYPNGSVKEFVSLEVPMLTSEHAFAKDASVDTIRVNKEIVLSNESKEKLKNSLDLKTSKNNLFHYNSTQSAISYIISPFNDTQLFKLYFYVKRASETFINGHNSCLNFHSVCLIDKNTLNEVNVHNCVDDIAPGNFNGSYIGANHGFDDMRKCKCVNHNKTFADIGSKWICDNNIYTIIGVETDYIYLLGENISEYPIFSMRNAPTGEYTHLSGATNTESFIVTSTELQQMWDQDRLVSLNILADDELIEDSGDYYFDKLKICETYDVINQADTLKEIQRLVGTFTANPIFSQLLNVNTAVRYSNTYTFTSADSWTFAVSFTAVLDIRIGYFGFIQQSVLPGSNVNMYIPKALPISNGEETLDFRIIASHNRVPQTMDITYDYWENPLLPPDRYLQYSDAIGLFSGFLFDYGVGGANRKDNINNAFFLYTSRKCYPHGIDDKITMNAGTTKSAVVFRRYIDRSKINSNGVILSDSFEYEGKLYLFADFNASGYYDISVPLKYNGKKIETFEKSDNVTLLNDISANKIIVKVETNEPMYGYIVLQIK